MKKFDELITETVILELENDEGYYNTLKEYIEENGVDQLDDFVQFDLILDEMCYTDNPLLYDIVETALSYVYWPEVVERFLDE